MATRTVSTVLREMQQVKSQVEDVAVRKALLAPLEAELKAMADAASRQGVLALEAEKPAKPK